MSAERPTSMQNCTWPILRASRGWQRGVLAKRAEAALRHLVRTPLGSILWAPDYGWVIELIRTQGHTKESIATEVATLQGACAKWVPYVQVTSLGIEAPPDTETLALVVKWFVPAEGGTRARAALGPFSTKILV